MGLLYDEIPEEVYMANNEDGIQSQRVGGGNHQLVIITQLLQMSVNMRHIDEMFLWLSHIIGQRLNVDVLQFWAYQAHVTGQHSAELRATASQNTVLPLHLVNNPQVAEIVRDLLTERSGVNPQLVTNIFSSRQADLLSHYNINYWASCFLGSGELLPPLMSTDPSQGAIPTPLSMVISLFSQQLPHPSLLPTIKRILEHALSIAKNRGLLSGVSKPVSGNLTTNWAQPKQITFNELVPHLTQDMDAMQAGNPFADDVVISDKKARQLYFAIDGKKSVAELVNSTRMDQQGLNLALQFLLKQKHIRLHEPNGKVIDSSQFFELL
jgi:hypothetical protein